MPSRFRVGMLWKYYHGNFKPAIQSPIPLHTGEASGTPKGLLVVLIFVSVTRRIPSLAPCHDHANLTIPLKIGKTRLNPLHGGNCQGKINGLHRTYGLYEI
ncbi:MAG: hypothetical protein COA78_20500 [Blastopirellula sp.]|nr:MAG: hypothetical protein COA78_20500 [Blastopirellula sp.]